MPTGGRRWLTGEAAGIVTLHGKETVIGPVLETGAGLVLHRVESVDTDAFGTFSREIERRGSALDAARSKVRAGFEAEPQVRIMVASEGTFAPHPAIPFLPVGDELVLLVDRETGLEIVGRDISPATNFGHKLCMSAADALDFASRSGFPGHGAIVLGVLGEAPAPDAFLCKTAENQEDLAAAVEEAIALTGGAFVETDMRAHRNPKRQDAIRRATQDLVRRLGSPCPACGRPGFDRVRRISGRPCMDCGTPTDQTTAWVLGCEACGLEETQTIPGEPCADPGACSVCNP